MPGPAFTQGVEPGGIFRKDDISLIICYMLTNIESGLRKEDVITVLSDNAIANYFEVADSFSEMVKKGNIYCCDEENALFTATDSGKMVSEQLRFSLPISLRDKVIKECIKLLARLKREKENTVEIEKIDKGYMVNCIVSGTSVNLMELKLYAPDLIQADIIKENFLCKPEKFYESALLLASYGEKENLD